MYSPLPESVYAPKPAGRNTLSPFLRVTFPFSLVSSASPSKHISEWNDFSSARRLASLFSVSV